MAAGSRAESAKKSASTRSSATRRSRTSTCGGNRRRQHRRDQNTPTSIRLLSIPKLRSTPFHTQSSICVQEPQPQKFVVSTAHDLGGAVPVEIEEELERNVCVTSDLPPL